jgi:hypothetical protein
MSIRTVIEVNHDYIDRLLKDGHISRDLYSFMLETDTWRRKEMALQGVQFLGQRHHSETLVLKVQ